MSEGEVHVQILVQRVDRIGAFLVITAISVLCSGLGFLIAYFRKKGRRFKQGRTFIALEERSSREPSSVPPRPLWSGI